MIQFNLLPDVKKDYVKARRTRMLITNIALLSSVVAVVVVVLTFVYVNVGQKGKIDALSTNISFITEQIQGTEDIDKILTVQNQLSLLQGLHEGRAELSRIFDYITFVTPKEAKVSTLNVSVETPQIKLSGTADSLATVNKFVNNLKIVRYALSTDEEVTVQPFSEVITSESGDNESATFSITLNYDPVIFANTTDIILSIGDQSYSTEGEDDQ